MLRLIARDLLFYQKRNLILLPGFSFFLCLMYLGMGNSITVAPVCLVIALFGLLMVVNNAFAYDEASKFDRMLRAMPLKPSVIVFARYAACYLVALLAVASLLVLFAITKLIPNFLPNLNAALPVSVREIVLYIAVLLLFSAVIIPVFYRFGYQKVKYPFMLLYIAIISSSPMLFSESFLQKAVSDLSAWSQNALSAVIVGVAVAVLAASVGISVWIYRRKEL